MQEPSEMRGFGDEALGSESDTSISLSMPEMVLPVEAQTALTSAYDIRHVTFLVLFVTLICLLLAVL